MVHRVTYLAQAALRSMYIVCLAWCYFCSAAQCDVWRVYALTLSATNTRFGSQARYAHAMAALRRGRLAPGWMVYFVFLKRKEKARSLEKSRKGWIWLKV